MKSEKFATENDELRELVGLSLDYLSDDRCEGCVTKTACNSGVVGRCWIADELIRRATALGIGGIGLSTLATVPYDTYQEVIDDLMSENEVVKAEKARLQERVSELEELTDGKHYIPQEWYAQLQKENRQMRNLATQMLQYVKYPYTVVRPEILVERARELGIEVK